MKKIAILGLMTLALYSCKKQEDTTLEVECEPEVTVNDYMPMAIGNYWVYEHVEIDSNNNEKKIGIVDSIKITRKEKLRGKEYYVFEGTNRPYTSYKSVVYMLRDSSGYLVNSEGNVLMSVINFTDTLGKFKEGSDTNWIYQTFGIMEREKTVVIAGIGPIRVINSVGHYVHNQKYLPQSKRLKVSVNNYYSRGVGKIVDTYFWSIEFLYSGKVIERRLVKYHIERE